MKLLYTTAVVLLLLSCIACGNSSTVNTPATQNMNGTWHFTAHSQSFGYVITGTANIQQTGSTIKGQTTVSGSPCADSASISGTVSGDSVTMELNENGDIVTFTGTLNSAFTSGSGSYAASLGCTNGDQGSWTATKE